MKPLKAGLLPLYLELYDQVLPGMRGPLTGFCDTIRNRLTGLGAEVVAASVCRLRSEVEEAVRLFEGEHVDAIVTLHLAYSPSLEAADVLAASRIPVLVLDTTPDFRFGPDQDPQALGYNHGIHGVQDLCNLLLRRRKKFLVEAGHWEYSDVLERILANLRAARLTGKMRSARVGRVGRSFAGMGDFAVPPQTLADTIGFEVVEADRRELMIAAQQTSGAAVAAEISSDAAAFRLDALDPEAHRCSAAAGLAVRRWCENQKLTAFSFNFMDVDSDEMLPTIPFLEASKSMSRGLGYAGEGDVLTAALVGSLASVYPETTFTEMFCPDWDKNQIFLSHMGEVNFRVLAQPPRLIPCPFPFTRVRQPVIGVGTYRPGEAVLINIAPDGTEGYSLIMAPVSVLPVMGIDRWADSVHGWIQPRLPIADFLAAYSRLGGTHHLAMAYGAALREVAAWGELMGWKVRTLPET
jgi:L-arabinose isomerase